MTGQSVLSRLWIPLVLFHGSSKGAREIFKKKAYEKNSVIETLFVYTALGFLMICPCAPSAMGMDFGRFIPWVAFKAFLVFLAWIFGFTAVSRMPVGLYGLLDLSRVIFSTSLGIIALGERPKAASYLGLVLVGAGLMLLKVQPKKEKELTRKEDVEKKYVFFAFCSAFLNACSGTLDKYLLGSTEITDNELLFWYSLFLVIYYIVYVLVRKIHIDFKTALKNPWIYLMALTFALGDKALFAANASPESTVAVMTIIKQCGCIVVILGGKFVFKEKRTAYKLVCAGIITLGIIIAALWK